MQLKSAVAMAVAQALAAAPIRFLAWELPYATGAAQKKEKKKKKKKKKTCHHIQGRPNFLSHFLSGIL